MVQQQVFAAQDGEDIVFRFGRQLRRRVGLKGRVLQIRPVDGEQLAETAEVEGTVDVIDVAGVQLQIRDQRLEKMVGNIARHLHAYDGAETALPDGFLDGFEQVV